MDFLSFLKKEYKPLNTIEVSISALEYNYSYLRNITDLEIAPALKSNAYGHGLVLTAKVLDKVGAPFFCVDSIYEAYELHKNNIKTPVLVMGHINPENLKVKRLPFSFAVSTPEMLHAVYTHQPHAGIHVFIDTGMYREGVPMDELKDFIALIKTKKDISIEGLMGHFGASDTFDDLTKNQVKNFQRAQKMFKEAGIHPKWIHHANSSGVLNYKNYKGKIGNMARCGIAIYGVDPENKNKDLRRALTFRSTLAQVKVLPKGASSGYNFTFTADKTMKIGVVSAGYNDGVDRRLSNIGYMKIGETFCKIIGRVSMNLTMIDVTDVPNPKIGDTVSVYSTLPTDKNAISESALESFTIAYDLLVKLSDTTRRIQVK